MGKKEFCTQCVEFNRKRMGPGWGRTCTVVEGRSCSVCPERQQVLKLPTLLHSLQVDNGTEKISREIDMQGAFKEKVKLGFLKQKTEYRVKSFTGSYTFGLEGNLNEKEKLDLLNEKVGNDEHLNAKLALELSNLKADDEHFNAKLSLELNNLKAELNEKSRLDLLEQKAEYEQLNSNLMLELSNLKSELNHKSRHDDVLNQIVAEYEQVNEKLSLELKNLKAEYHHNLSMIDFLKIRRDRNQGDVIIAVSDDNTQIFAHRAILAERSPVFQKLLQRCSSEKQTKATPVIKVDSFSDFLSSGPVLAAIVDFCHSGQITFSDIVLPGEVFKAAHALKLGFLIKLTEAELCRSLTLDNVPHMLKLARDFSAFRLQAEAGMLFKENFDILSSKVFEVMEEPRPSSSYMKASDLQVVLLHLYTLLRTAAQNWARSCMDLMQNRT